MRHGKKINHLSRKAPHRQALLSNMATSLIVHKRITTTVAKAKALRKYVEPIITRSKTDTTHSRRMVFSYLQDKAAVSALFGEVASRVSERPGGYTRIIRLGNARLGDNAEMCMMELVDFNEIYKNDKETAKKGRTRRGRSKTKKDDEGTAAEEVTTTQAEQPEEAPKDSEAEGEAEKSGEEK